MDAATAILPITEREAQGWNDSGHGTPYHYERRTNIPTEEV